MVVMNAPEQVNIKQLTFKMLKASQSNPAVTPVIVYMMALITGLTGEEAKKALPILLPLIVIPFTAVLPYFLIFKTLQNAFDKIPGEAPGARLVRMLKAPRQIEVVLQGSSALGVMLFTGAAAVYFGKSLWTVPWAVSVTGLVVSLMLIPVRLKWEEFLRPYALVEFHTHPEATPRASGLMWIRQSWYLPYAFGLFVMCTLAMVMTIVLRQAIGSYVVLREAVEQGVTQAEMRAVLDATVASLTKESLVPIFILGTYLLVSAGHSAWNLAKNQSQGALRVQDAMEALASGTPKLPEWISSDEIGSLSTATAGAFARLKAFSLSLGESAQALRRSAETLGFSTTKQSEVISIQASALQETQVTVQEIKQTSAVTSQKAEGILKQAERADEISRAGEMAIQHSLSGLQEIGNQVAEIASRIRDLDQRTRQIASITTTVKDLADQSNMLALNAAIEAVRSGEHGKGFGVVAREIRSLADQSIRATNNVRGILQDISQAIRTTATITAKNSEKVESSLNQVREFGDNIRQLSGIVRENASSVRQITAAVTQQNTGISQITQAVNDLSGLMDQTMTQLRASDEALDLVRSVTNKVASFAGAEANTEVAAGGQAASTRGASV